MTVCIGHTNLTCTLAPLPLELMGDDMLARLTLYKQVVYYLMTDSLNVREQALTRLGKAKLLTFDSTKVELFHKVSMEGFK